MISLGLQMGNISLPGVRTIWRKCFRLRMVSAGSSILGCMSAYEVRLRLANLSYSLTFLGPDVVRFNLECRKAQTKQPIIIHRRNGSSDSESFALCSRSSLGSIE